MLLGLFLARFNSLLDRLTNKLILHGRGCYLVFGLLFSFVLYLVNEAQTQSAVLILLHNRIESQDAMNLSVRFRFVWEMMKYDIFKRGGEFIVLSNLRNIARTNKFNLQLLSYFYREISHVVPWLLFLFYQFLLVALLFWFQ